MPTWNFSKLIHMEKKGFWLASDREGVHTQ